MGQPRPQAEAARRAPCRGRARGIKRSWAGWRDDFYSGASEAAALALGQRAVDGHGVAVEPTGAPGRPRALQVDVFESGGVPTVNSCPWSARNGDGRNPGHQF